MPAQTVNKSPILVESSGLISIVEAAVRKTYSLIPIPPNEKIDRIEDIRKINIISMKFLLIPTERSIKIKLKNWVNWISAE